MCVFWKETIANESAQEFAQIFVSLRVYPGFKISRDSTHCGPHQSCKPIPHHCTFFKTNPLPSTEHLRISSCFGPTTNVLGNRFERTKPASTQKYCSSVASLQQEPLDHSLSSQMLRGQHPVWWLWAAPTSYSLCCALVTPCYSKRLNTITTNSSEKQSSRRVNAQKTHHLNECIDVQVQILSGTGVFQIYPLVCQF